MGATRSAAACVTLTGTASGCPGAAPVAPVAPVAGPVTGPIAGTDADLRYCSFCGADRPFDRPLCPDGHDDCPEEFCRACGDAVLTGTEGLFMAASAGWRGALLVSD